MPNIQETDMFMLSVDTEVKVNRVDKFEQLSDACILGKIGNKEFGIPLIMSMLEERKMKGVFFVDFPCVYLIGEKKFREFIELIIQRGHDVQLHLHPTGFYHSKLERLKKISKEWSAGGTVAAFRASIEHCVELFEKYTGVLPIAYRGGAYHFKRKYMDVLVEFNFLYDSTFNSFRNWHAEFAAWESCCTIPYKIRENLIEFPITWAACVYYDPGNAYHNKNKKIIVSLNCGSFDYNSQIFKNAMLNLANRPPIFFMSLLHSFTFLQQEKIYNQNDNETVIRYSNLDSERVKILASMLDTVAEIPSIQTVTFQDLKKMNYQPPNNPYPVEPFPEYMRDISKHSYSWLRKYSSSYLKNLEETYGI